MIIRILAVAAILALPLNALLWRQSHVTPIQHRYDISPTKSLRIYLIDGVCGLRLLSLPTKTNLKTEFHTSLNYDPTPGQRSFMLSSSVNGPYRTTWLVFPLWLTTGMLMIVGGIPIFTGPVLRWWRKWKGNCIQCGYNLRGNRSGRCSECGLRFRHADSRVRRY